MNFMLFKKKDFKPPSSEVSILSSEFDEKAFLCWASASYKRINVQFESQLEKQNHTTCNCLRGYVNVIFGFFCRFIFYGRSRNSCWNFRWNVIFLSLKRAKNVTCLCEKKYPNVKFKNKARIRTSIFSFLNCIREISWLLFCT